MTNQTSERDSLVMAQLAMQRNAAMDACVNYAADLELARERIKDLEAQVAGMAKQVEQQPPQEPQS